MDTEKEKNNYDLPELIESLTPIIILFVTGVISIASLFTPYADKGLGLFGLAVSGTCGLSQPFNRKK